MEKKIICDFCKNEISIEKLGRHLKNKHIHEFEDKIALTKFFFSTKENISMDIVNQIISEYEYTSVLHIENKYSIKFRNYLNGLGLKSKTISESRKTDTTKEKQRLTNIVRYGVDNVSKSQKIKEKKKNTFQKNYGVDNIWKVKEYRTWWEMDMVKKYGTCCLSNLHGNTNNWGWKSMSETEKNNRISKLNNTYKSWYYNLSETEKTKFIQNKSYGFVKNSSSKLETRIENILNKNNIFNKPQFWINRNSYDFWLGNKLLLEVQGTYWHCDSRKYKENDIINFNGELFMVSEIWKKDKQKKENAENYGYNVVYLWELDINKMSDEELLKFIHYENQKHKENNK